MRAMPRSIGIRFALAMASWICCSPVSAQDLPPVGRSLFDHLTIDAQGFQRVPFPFAALMQRVQREVGADALGHPGVRSVLIPLGRSLQRNASVAEAYRYPRIVAAVVGEPLPGAPLLKDRLYLGYHEKAGVLEVISYNEAAGRFEFQVVKDYREGGNATVFYARRVICTSCHHGVAPIFSRPGWDETNANPRVAAELKRAGGTFHGVPAARSIDEPNAIDNAVARSSRLDLTQRIWREGCLQAAAIDCRAEALLAALKYRLGAELAVDAKPQAYRAKLLSPLRAAGEARWPDGLAVIDPSIPNRDPLATFPVDRADFGDGAALLRTAEVRTAFDPLQPRAPIARWQAGNEADVAGYIRGVAEFVATRDIDAIDRRLRELRTKSARRVVRANCRVVESSRAMTLQCASEPSADPSLRAEARLTSGEGEAATATLSGLSVAGATSASSIALAQENRRPAPAQPKTWTYRGPPLRMPDATAVERIALRWAAGNGSAAELELLLADDTPLLARAIDTLAQQARAGQSDALGDAPIRRGVLMRGLFAQLGIPAPRACCDLPLNAAPPQVDTEAQRSRDVLPAQMQTFVRHCAACHDTREDAPPGFLHGSAEAVGRNLKRCAERISYRLAMWEQAPEQRQRVPMPPPLANSVAVPPPPPEDLAQMRAYIAQLAGPSVYGDVPYEARPACRADSR